MTIELLPCPFCGSNDLTTIFEDDFSENKKHIKCNKCWCKGPWNSTFLKEYRKSWNDRK